MEYKGLPLVRSGNTIYYGNPSDEYVIRINITESVTSHSINTSCKLLIHLVKVPETYIGEQSIKIIKTIEKTNLIDGLDIGVVWLNRFNSRIKG